MTLLLNFRVTEIKTEVIDASVLSKERQEYLAKAVNREEYIRQQEKFGKKVLFYSKKKEFIERRIEFCQRHLEEKLTELTIEKVKNFI